MENEDNGKVGDSGPSGAAPSYSGGGSGESHRQSGGRTEPDQGTGNDAAGTGGSEGTGGAPGKQTRGRPRKSGTERGNGADKSGNGGAETPSFEQPETGNGHGGGGSGGNGATGKRGRKPGGKKKESVSSAEIEEYAALYVMAHAWLAKSMGDDRWALSMDEGMRIMAPLLRILARYFPIGGGSSDFALLIVALLAVYGPRLMMKPEKKTEPRKGETFDADFTDVTPV